MASDHYGSFAELLGSEEEEFDGSCFFLHKQVPYRKYCNVPVLNLVVITSHLSHLSHSKISGPSPFY